MKEKVIAFDQWYADFYSSRAFVKVMQIREKMHMIAMKQDGKLIAYMHAEPTPEGNIVYVYPTPLTLAAAVRKNGVDEYTVYMEDGLQVFGGVRW